MFTCGLCQLGSLPDDLKYTKTVLYQHYRRSTAKMQKLLRLQNVLQEILTKQIVP